jgi:hypothetical protein
MSRLRKDVEALMPVRSGSPLLDGVLLGAVIGAAAAALVVVTQAVVIRRISRRYGPTGLSSASGGSVSPL